MHYKTISTADLNQVLELKQYCFEPSHANTPEADILPWLEKGAALGGYEGDKLATQLLVFPLDTNVFGVEMKVGGIGWVSTYPEYRLGGHTSQLMLETLEMMRKDGQVLSALSPFSEEFYRKFGWEVFFENTEYRIFSSELALREPLEGKVVRFNYREKGEWFEKVKAFQRHMAGKLNGHVLRADEWWERLEGRAPEDHFAVCVDEQDAVTGYIRYFIKDEIFKVKDFYSLNHRAEKVLWGYIGSHQSQVKEVVGHAPARDSFTVLFKEPNIRRKIYFDKMIRIVDVEAFLNQYPFEKLEETLYVRVTDSQAAWNDAFFRIAVDGSVEKVENAPEEAVLQMEIGPFSAMMVGFHGIEWYVRNGSAVLSEAKIAVWRQALPSGFPSINEIF